MKKEELLQAIKNYQLADYVSENWWKIARSDMKNLLVQVLFTMFDNGLREDKIDIYELLERLDLDEE